LRAFNIEPYPEPLANLHVFLSFFLSFISLFFSGHFSCMAVIAGYPIPSPSTPPYNTSVAELLVSSQTFAQA
jgi:hypothetical protein